MTVGYHGGQIGGESQGYHQVTDPGTQGMIPHPRYQTTSSNPNDDLL